MFLATKCTRIFAAGTKIKRKTLFRYENRVVHLCYVQAWAAELYYNILSSRLAVGVRTLQCSRPRDTWPCRAESGEGGENRSSTGRLNLCTRGGSARGWRKRGTRKLRRGRTKDETDRPRHLYATGRTGGKCGGRRGRQRHGPAGRLCATHRSPSQGYRERRGGGGPRLADRRPWQCAPLPEEFAVDRVAPGHRRPSRWFPVTLQGREVRLRRRARHPTDTDHPNRSCDRHEIGPTACARLQPDIDRGKYAHDTAIFLCTFRLGSTVLLSR